MKNTDVGRLTKRFAMCLIGCGMVYWFLDKHRDWTYCYFATMQGYPDSTQLAVVAQAGIAAITTVANVAITGIVGIVFFLVTGNVLALRSFNFASAVQSAATLTSTAATSVSESIQREIREAEKKFAGDPSYRPPESLTDKDTEVFR